MANKKSFLSIIAFCLLSAVSKGQTIALQNYSYFVSEDKVSCLDYTVTNNTQSSIVTMFTKDDISGVPIEDALIKTFYKKHGDFCWAQVAWEDIIGMDLNIRIPEFFIRIIKPNDSFRISIVAINSEEKQVDSLFRKHLLCYSIMQDDKTEIIKPLIEGVDRNHAEYPYNSLIVQWEYLKNCWE